MVKLEKEVIGNIKKAMEAPMEVAYNEGINLFGLPIFWKIGQDSYTSKSDLKTAECYQIALDSMKEIFE
jgi:hypothetical protein